MRGPSVTEVVSEHRFGGLRAGIGRPAGHATLGKVLELASLVLMVTVVPRALGPGDYGVFAVATSLVTLGSLSLALGGPTLMARFVPVVPEHDRTSLARALAMRTAWWRAGALTVIAIVALAAAGVWPDTLPLMSTTLILVALAIDVVATLLLQVAFALQRVLVWSLRYPVQNIVLVVASVALGIPFGAAGVLVAVVVSTLAALALAVWSVRGLTEAPTWARPLPDGLGRFAALQGAGTAALLLQHRGAILAVALLGVSSTEIGFAGLAIGAALALASAGVQPFVAELPRLVGRRGTEPAATEREVVRLGWLVLGALGVVATAAAALADPLLELVAGPAFAGAGAALGAALVGVPFAAALGVLTTLSALRVQPELRLAALAAGLGAVVLVSVALVPDHGALGGAVAFAVGAAVTAFAGAMFLPRVLGLRFVCASVAVAAVVGAVGVIG